MSTEAQAADRLAEAAELLEGFVDGSPELREAAIFDPSGRQLFGTGDGDLTAAAARLWEAAGAGERPVASVHVGGGSGEVFAVRGEAGSAIALADRFALASLVLSDLRAIVRELGGGVAVTADGAAEPHANEEPGEGER